MQGQRARKLLGIACIGLCLFGAGLMTSRFIDSDQPVSLTNPFVPEPTLPPKPLLKYTIPNLKNYPFTPSQLRIEREQESSAEFTSYVFSFTTMGKRMTGQLNVPAATLGAAKNEPLKTILLVRGYVPPDIFETGVGTKHAAAVFARNGYVTIAPDFFGYGESDSEPTDPWEARFLKPINVAELIKSVNVNGLPTAIDEPSKPATISGMWAHSNGGQIALTTLEILSESIPTTLWAPVTAPFPYSILFFGDEEEDEGKAQRKWISIFEDEYDAFDFSLTKHLDLLRGPLRIHHGTTDDAALYSWSVEFAQKLTLQNDQPAAIDFELFTYHGANHNLQPIEHWNQAIARDLAFFKNSNGLAE